MRNSINIWIKKYYKLHNMTITDIPKKYVSQSWRNNHRPFQYYYNDRITRAYNFINKHNNI